MKTTHGTGPGRNMEVGRHWAGALALAMLCCAMATAQNDVEEVIPLAPRETARAGSPVAAATEAGVPRFGRAPEGRLRIAMAPRARHFQARYADPCDPEATAREFVRQYGKEFHVGHTAFDFVAKAMSTDVGRTYVRADQSFASLPVFAGETVVQLNRQGRVESIFTDLMTDEEAAELERTWTDPSITGMDARYIAVAALEETHPGLQFQAEPAILTIYAPSVVGNVGAARLVWNTTVAGVPEPAAFERVLVDAHTGEIALRYSLLRDAQYRVIYDAQNSSTGSLKRLEGWGPTGLADVDKAYDYLGDVDFFYRQLFGRDGIDNAGIRARAFVRVCFPDEPCPWPNAQWAASPYNYFLFGEGFVADDVVAHEFTHGVTGYVCGLEYLNESGAIDEFLADSMAELRDLTNGLGDDSDAVRWLCGEDVIPPWSFGDGRPALRNMRNPCESPYLQPDRKGGPYWQDWHTDPSDNGGVHQNCGVGNKLCYLLTDGDTSNGYTIYPLDGRSEVCAERVARLLYQTMYHLTSAASYDDLSFALLNAADVLGWTESEKQNLENACRAVGIAVL